MTRPLRPPVRRRPVHRRQRHGRPRDPRGPAGRRRDRRAARRRRTARRHRGGRRARCGRRRRSSRPSRKPRRRSPRRSRPGGRCTSTAGRRRSWTAPAASRCSTTMWPLLRALAGSIVVLAGRGGRARCGSSPSARTSSPKAPPAARSPRRSAAAPGRGKVVAVVSGGNIDLATFASLVGACDDIASCHRVRSASCILQSSHEQILDLPPLPERINRLDELAVDLWWSWNRDARDGLPAARLHAVARDRAQPGADAVGRFRARSSKPRPRDPEFLRALRPRHRRARRCARGAEHVVGRTSFRSWPGSRSRTSPPSSRCTSRCRSTPAASACSPAITARKPATSACRSSASASCIRRATSTSTSRAEGWQEESYERLNWADAPIEPALTAGRQAVRHGRAARRSHGARRGLARAPRAASSCTCSTPISKRTRRGIASCRRGSTAAIARRASSRKSFSASAACAR